MKSISIELIKKLQNAGYEAYWAGGCVRDMLLKITPKDFDIVTSAKPEEVKKIIPKTSEVGKSFGVIVTRIENYNFEIATFRTDSEYKDARHPEKVFFTNAIDDAKRRDFTINGMFYDPITNKIIDYVGGREDISNKIVKFIGNPNDRIKEDNLRILRAIRFKNVLNFKYDKRTWDAIKSNAYRIESVSYERIMYELNRMFNSKNRAQSLVDLHESGLLKYILPEVEKMIGVPQPHEYHAEGDVFTHTVWALKTLPNNTPITLVWAVLLHDVGKPPSISYPKDKNDRIRFNNHVKYSAGLASKICRRLKMPNFERNLIVWLVKNHMIIGDIAKMSISKKRKFLMDHRFKWLLQLHKADALGSSPKDLSLYNQTLKMYNIAFREHEIELKKPKFKMLLSGDDIILNFKLDSGPKIGKLLKILEDAQLEGKVKTKEEAIKFLENKIN